MYKKEILANGLKVVSHEMKDRDSISLGVWFNAGGRYEEDRIKGAAHFLEHMVFKGSKKYACEKIKQLIEGVGGSLNAFTAEEQTCYHAKIPAKHLEQTFDVLADMAFFPNIATDDLNKEKTVIMEEIKMYHDIPQYHVMELLDGLVWPNHPLGKSLAGTMESVGSTTRENLLGFHRRYYGPGNAAIVAAGKISHAKLSALVKKKLGRAAGGGGMDFIKASNTQTAPRLNLYKKDIEQMHLALGMLGYNLHQKERYILSLLSIILGGNMSSRLFVEVREKHGLAYSISSYSKPLTDTGIFLIKAGVDNKRLTQALKLILKELQKIAAASVGQEEFGRAREYVIGQLLLGLEDTMDQMLWAGESIMARNQIRTMKEVVNEFKKITPSDVRRAAKEILDPRRFNLALIGPLTDEQEKEIRSLFGVRG